MDPTICQAEEDIIRHWDCVATAVNRVFATSCGTEIEICNDDEAGAASDTCAVAAIISFVGDVEWSVFLVYPEETATAVASSFAGFEISPGHPDVADALGEVANIVAGGIKLMLRQQGVSVEMSLPTALSGRGLKLCVLEGISSWQEGYDCSHGRFWGGIFIGNSRRLAAS